MAWVSLRTQTFPKSLYLILVPHGSSPKDGDLCSSFLLKAFDGVPLRSQDLSNEVELDGEKKQKKIRNNRLVHSHYMTQLFKGKPFGLEDKKNKSFTYAWVLLYRDQHPLLYPNILCAKEVKVGLSFFLGFAFLDPFDFCRRDHCWFNM